MNREKGRLQVSLRGRRKGSHKGKRRWHGVSSGVLYSYPRALLLAARTYKQLKV